MASVYLIGGAPRVGKTSLAMRVLQKRPMFAISADSVRDMLQGVLKPVGAPALFKLYELTQNESAIASFLHDHPREGVVLQNDESSFVWPSVDKLICSYLADGQDILVEGVEILPANLKQASYSYKVVFLGNTSLVHANTIAAQAHANEHDWMHRYSDKTIEGWSDLVREFSNYIEAETNTYRMPFIETHDDNFEDSLLRAEGLLLG
jgi:2-phosphoglycerate kinase